VATQSPPAALRREGTRQEAEETSPPTPGWYTPRAAVYEPARPTLPPPCGHERPANPPPKLKPRAKTWDGVRDGGLGAQEASAESARGFYLGGFACTDRLCPAAWAYDLQVQTCRYFLTGVVRPVSLYLWGSTYVWWPRRTAGGGGEVVTVHHAQWHLPRSWIER
jgi:hypothetical protein